MEFVVGVVPLGARTIVVRLPDGTLWVHSPIALEPQWRDQLEALGKVAHVVAPNTFHFGHHAEWVSAYPEARFYALPDLPTPKGGRFDELLEEEALAAWSEVIDQTILRGSRLYREAIFCHRSSGTLILTDLVMNMERPRSPWDRLARTIIGFPMGLGTTRLSRLLMVKDKAAARSALEKALSWKWERMSVAHGDIVEKDGPRQLRRLYSRLWPA